jgi:hypothetical protein
MRIFRSFVSRISRAIGAMIAGSPKNLHLAQAQGLSENLGAPSEPQEKGMVSGVVLANTYLDLTLELVRAKLDEVFPGEFLPPRDQGNFVIDGTVPGQFFINAHMPGAAGTFFLHNVPGPYTEFSNFARFIADPTMRREATAQRCWLSLDLINKASNHDKAYRFIERVLAKFAPADTTFLVHPSKLITIRFDDDLRGRLARAERILPNLQ